MKGVFYGLTIIFLSIFVSCVMGNIPDITFNFVNEMTGYFVTITPDSGEDWNGFTLAADSSYSIESENSNINFTPLIDGVTRISLNNYFTYDSSTRTYTFTGYP